jgi:hypothetical protein
MQAEALLEELLSSTEVLRLEKGDPRPIGKTFRRPPALPLAVSWRTSSSPDATLVPEP